jgi:hypothetical protein
VNPARPDSVVFQVVALIAPDEQRRSDCVNRAHLAIKINTARREDLPYMLHHRTKRAKGAALRLQKALDRLQERLADPDLHKSLRPGGRWPKLKRLRAWRERAAAVRDQAKGKPLNVDMMLRMSAAESAYILLKRFNKKTAMTKGSTFCRLAALLYGKPKANLQNACRKVIYRWSMKKSFDQH